MEKNVTVKTTYKYQIVGKNNVEAPVKGEYVVKKGQILTTGNLNSIKRIFREGVVVATRDSFINVTSKDLEVYRQKIDTFTFKKEKAPEFE